MRLVTASPESIMTKKKRELLLSYKSKMDLMNKRIEEVREKWNIVQNESLYKNKQVYGQRSFRLTLEQELVIKGNLSEMWVYFNYYNLKNYYVNIIFITTVKSIFFFFFTGAPQY